MAAKDGWALKAPALSDRDHLTPLKEPMGIGKHLTDEQGRTPRRHGRVGKITPETPRPDLMFNENRSVELSESEELYVYEFAA